LATYTAREYFGPITLIRARTQPLASWLAHDLGWGRLAKGGLDIRMIPGAHDNILTEPRVRVLAAHLQECLAPANLTTAGPASLSLVAGWGSSSPPLPLPRAGRL
jgi:thioesterase domain-containing protein